MPGKAVTETTRRGGKHRTFFPVKYTVDKMSMSTNMSTEHRRMSSFSSPIHKKAFANRAVTREFRTKLDGVDRVLWSAEKTRAFDRLYGEDCGEAKKELAQRAEAYGVKLVFTSASSHQYGLDMETQDGAFQLHKPLAPRYPKESVQMFQEAHATLDKWRDTGIIQPLMQRPWHQLASTCGLRVVNTRDKEEQLFEGLSMIKSLSDLMMQQSLWLKVGIDTEGNDGKEGAKEHLYQIAIYKTVVLVHPDKFESFRMVLNQDHVLVAAFDASDSSQLRALLPRAHVVDVQLAAASAALVPPRFALDRTYNKLFPDESFRYTKGEAKKKREMHFTRQNKITWSLTKPLSSKMVAYAASDAYAHLACMLSLMQLQRKRMTAGQEKIMGLPIEKDPPDSPSYSPIPTDIEKDPSDSPSYSPIPTDDEGVEV